jgi:small nuclear ribonucleoprotein (snRNP)-like protein
MLIGIFSKIAQANVDCRFSRAYCCLLIPGDVIVMTKDTTVYEGVIESCDHVMNLVMVDVTEKQNKEGAVVSTRRNMVMLRGDQVYIVSPNDRVVRHLRAGLSS